MSRQTQVEIIEHLTQANACKNDVWQMWQYTDKKLILCGYRETFNVKGLLVFHDTSHIFLQCWVDKATFQLGNLEEAKVKDLLLKRNITSKELIILITTKSSEYFVVCEDVEFRILLKGCNV
jgi:hypothetical protein